MDENDLNTIQKIEKELNIKLEKLDKINIFNNRGYIVNEKGQVTGLYLYRCEIQDLNRIISPLKGLTQLTYLDLDNNQIVELSPLKDLTQLTQLDLFNNQISDLTPLKNLTQLTGLGLSCNQINDLSPLKDLSGLIDLNLNNNRINDLSSLESLKKLQHLDLTNNPIEELPSWITDFDMDIQWEAYFGGGIVLYNNPLKKPPIEIVKQGTEAIKKYFAQLPEKEQQTLNQIEKELNVKLEKLEETDILSEGYVLNEKGQVTGLGLWFCKIQDLNRIISPLKGLTQLTHLDLSWNQIEELSGLEGLTQLTELYLRNNQIKELSPLKDLTQLTHLNLSNNKIKELSALKDLMQLTDLDLNCNQISDLLPLISLRKLEHLNIKNNPIKKLPWWITDPMFYPYPIYIQWNKYSYFYNLLVFKVKKLLSQIVRK